MTNIQDTGVLRFAIGGHVTTHREASRTHVHVLLINEAECHRHVINDPKIHCMNLLFV